MRAPGRIRRTPVVAVTLVILGLVALGLVATSRGTNPSPKGAAFSPSLDPGTPLHGPAADFTLTDQFDKPVSLSSFRGKVVLLAFNDSECTTICPLTTQAMVDAKRMLGSAGSELALLGVDANPDATSVKDVRSYSELHGMTHLWHFTTGSRRQLEQVWRAYHIDVEIQAGQIDHTPALFMIDPHGKLERLYLTQMSYGSITQQAQLLAREASRLLPQHPAVHSKLSYRTVKTVSPAQHTSLPLASGKGTLKLGPGSTRLLLFFASWDQEVMNLRGELNTLNGYARKAAAAKLPPLVAVDEGSVEPDASALTRFLDHLAAPPDYPVAVDASGEVADGYGVQDEPWLVLVSRSGRPLWYRDISTEGWMSVSALVSQVRAALDTKTGAISPAVVRSELKGSPPPLAALHADAGRLLSSGSVASKLRSLRGYPVVVNVWASSCAPCRAEFGLLASAAARYGRQVAFLGADIQDNSGDARAFLSHHPVSYPSYPISTDQMLQILPQGLSGTPTTIFYDAKGHRRYVHSGQYESQGTLDADVAQYALGG